jgi:hypothetical protein
MDFQDFMISEGDKLWNSVFESQATLHVVVWPAFLTMVLRCFIIHTLSTSPASSLATASPPRDTKTIL